MVAYWLSLLCLEQQREAPAFLVDAEQKENRRIA